MVERPHWIWWALILPSLTLLAFLACSPPLFESWLRVTRLPLPHGVYQGLLVFAAVMHVGEGSYALLLARSSAESPRAVGWGLQTFLLGYPSLRLLLARVRASRQAGSL